MNIGVAVEDGASSSVLKFMMVVGSIMEARDLA
jgi:hypothetical protein